MANTSMVYKGYVITLYGREFIARDLNDVNKLLCTKTLKHMQEEIDKFASKKVQNAR